MATGDSGCEAYTAIAWGVGLSHERSDIAGAEGFHSLEGNMCGTAMRGADALPGSKATSRAKGSHRNLGGLGSGRQMLCERDGPHWEGEEQFGDVFRIFWKIDKFAQPVNGEFHLVVMSCRGGRGD